MTTRRDFINLSNGTKLSGIFELRKSSLKLLSKACHWANGFCVSILFVIQRNDETPSSSFYYYYNSVFTFLFYAVQNKRTTLFLELTISNNQDVTPFGRCLLFYGVLCVTLHWAHHISLTLCGPMLNKIGLLRLYATSIFPRCKMIRMMKNNLVNDQQTAKVKQYNNYVDGREAKAHQH